MSKPDPLKRTVLSSLPGPVLVGDRWVAPGSSEIETTADEVKALQTRPYLKVLAAA